MKKLNKKAFTIVELIVVIVIIGILAAILIPNVVKYIDQTKIVKDKELVSNLNKALVLDKTVKGIDKHETAYDAVLAAKESGYLVANINKASKGENEILWDSLNDLFCYLDTTKGNTFEEQLTYVPNYEPEKNPVKSQLFKFYKGEQVSAETKFSVYLGEGATLGEGEYHVGIDVGEETNISEIKFYGLNVVNEADRHDVVIRTNSASTSLSIDAAADTVKHYGAVGSLNIIAVANMSYHEFGQVAFAEIATGRIVLESESKVEHIHLNTSVVKNNNNEDEVVFNNIIVAKAESVEMPEFSRDPVEIPEEGKLVVALQDGTDKDDDKDYVWLTAVGIYEQVTVSDSKDDAKNNYAATSTTASQEQKTAAQQIANNITFTAENEEYKVTAKTTDNGETWTYEVVDQTGTVSEDYSASKDTTQNTVNVQTTGETPEAVETTKENGISEAAKEEKQTELINEAKAPEVAKEYAENGDALIYNLTTGVYYNDLYTAIDEVPASTKTTLILLKDITGVSNKNYVIKTNQVVIFDLNGCKFNTVAPDGNTAYAIENKGTLTIKDNTDKNKNGTGNGKLELNALDPDTLDIPGYASNVITNRGTLVIESGWIHNASSNGMAAFAIDNDSRATGTNNKLIVNGGKITTAAASSIRQCVLTGSTSDVIINGGVIGSYWIQNYGNSTTSATGTLTINNVEALYGYRLDLGYSIDYSWNVKGENIIVVINGGYFKSLTVYSKNNAKTDIIKGGTFTNNVSAYCKEGYFTKEVSGKYEVRPISQATSEDFVAYVGEQGYLDFELAQEAANGNAIKLNKDLRGYLIFSDGGTYTLDLNGHNIVNYSGSGNTDTVNVYNNTTLTITDSSSGEKGTISSEVGVAIWTGSPATDTSCITIDGGVKLVGSTHSIQSSGGTTTVIINNAVITGDFDINDGSTLTDNR